MVKKCGLSLIKSIWLYGDFLQILELLQFIFLFKNGQKEDFQLMIFISQINKFIIS